MIAALPVKNRPAYFAAILEQTLTDLLPTATTSGNHPADVYWRTGAWLVADIYPIRPDLVQQSVFEPVWQTLTTNGGGNIEAALTTLHRLVFAARCCLDQLARFFTPLFAIRFHLDSVRVSPLRSSLDEALAELLREIPRSVYLLDSTVSLEPESSIDRYRVVVESGGQCSIEVVRSDQVQPPVDRVDQLNQFATFTLHFLLGQMSSDFCFDFFFLLLERMISAQPPPVAALLLGPLADRLFGATVSRDHETRRESRLLGSKRTARFLCSTTERVVSRLVKPVDDDDDEAESVAIWKETLSICLMIMSTLLEELEDNPKRSAEIDLLEELKPCQTSLGVLLGSSAAAIDPSDREMAEQIYSKFELLLVDRSTSESNGHEASNGEYEPLVEAIAELTHPLLPIRAHALISIKHLVYTKHRSVQDRFEEVVSNRYNHLTAD